MMPLLSAGDVVDSDSENENAPRSVWYHEAKVETVNTARPKASSDKLNSAESHKRKRPWVSCRKSSSARQKTVQDPYHQHEYGIRGLR